ncbi:MAG: phosphoribosylanthranilate isomerase [Candidatus Sumerlaeota bacterium]|nr:phosphoribosylanthranilate isomerase [Candidatus Sumerlaeota bacterium]
MPQTKIKICGIVSPGEALHALRCGADFLGFNFYPPSPRYIAPETVGEILAFLRANGYGRVEAVGVFVDCPPADIRRIASERGLRIVQLHGSETPDDVKQLDGFTRIKAVRVRDASCAEEMARYGAEAYLAEAPSLAAPGGTGQSYDYALAREAARRHRLFLAGGLRPETVAEAIRIVRPYAVDVASGVESAPGVKDPAKVEAFCRAVRELD